MNHPQRINETVSVDPWRDRRWQRIFLATNMMLILFGLFATPTPCHAGLYSLDEPFVFDLEDGIVKPMQFPASFEIIHADLRDLNAPTSQLARTIADRIQKRQAKGVGAMNADELASYATDLIRLNRSEAINMLQPLARDPRRGGFLAYTHLAVAHANRGEWREAADQQLSAVKYAEFPASFGRLTKTQLTWFKRVERDYYLPWLNHRASESRRAKRSDLREDPDPLFGVQFVSNEGDYQAGKLADAERKKLPADAIAIVQQMVLWHPRDARLYWLLGELYNAEGDIETAAKILDTCTFSQGYSNPILKEHRRILQAAMDGIRAGKAAEAKEAQDKADAEQAANEFAAREERKRTQWIVACVVAGVLLLLYFQVREIARRLRRRQTR